MLITVAIIYSAIAIAVLVLACIDVVIEARKADRPLLPRNFASTSLEIFALFVGCFFWLPLFGTLGIQSIYQIFKQKYQTRNAAKEAVRKLIEQRQLKPVSQLDLCMNDWMRYADTVKYGR